MKNECMATILHFSFFIMKRYCQTLELYDDKELIEAYVAEHAHGTGLCTTGYPAPSGGMGSAHGEVPESRSGSYLTGEMEADEADI